MEPKQTIEAIAHAARDEVVSYPYGLPLKACAPNMTTSYGHMGYFMNINVTEFKAKCLKLMDTVAETHEPLTITKRGKPLVKLVPVIEDAPTSLFGYMKGTLTIHGDILAPIDETWSAESGDEDHLYNGLLTEPK